MQHERRLAVSRCVQGPPSPALFDSSRTRSTPMTNSSIVREWQHSRVTTSRLLGVIRAWAVDRPANRDTR